MIAAIPDRASQGRRGFAAVLCIGRALLKQVEAFVREPSLKLTCLVDMLSILRDLKLCVCIEIDLPCNFPT